jgi:UDPglucose 6-dehydrogenase
MKIAVVGAGYVGLVTATCLADLGHNVVVINRDPKKATYINAGHSPVYEPGLEILIKKTIDQKNLFATTDYCKMRECDISFICVGTPSQKDGSADLSMVKAASRSIGETLTNTKHPHVVVGKSTLPPGTTENVIKSIVLEYADREMISFAMNPEFLREGNAIHDFLYPDRIVIGSNDDFSYKIVASIYKKINAPILRTSVIAAEMIKYASNAFLATKISYANEIGNICKRMGIDVYEVMRGVGWDHRISPYFLNAGVGFGGSCLPKDVNALIHLAYNLGEDPCLLRAVMDINEQQPLRLISILEQKIGNLNGKRIAILGLAFKDNTDDIRDSRSIPVLNELLRKKANVVAFDPLANLSMQVFFPEIEYHSCAADALEGADACLVMTDWREFSHLSEEFDLMKNRVIIEGRRILLCKDSEGICW